MTVVASILDDLRADPDDTNALLNHDPDENWYCMPAASGRLLRFVSGTGHVAG